MSSPTLTIPDPPFAGRRQASGWPTALIQRVAERVERVAAAHPLVSDLALAAAVAAAAVVGLSSQGRLDGLQLVFSAALSLMLLLRRSQPLLVFLGLALIAALQWLIAEPQLGDAALRASDRAGARGGGARAVDP